MKDGIEKKIIGTDKIILTEWSVGVCLKVKDTWREALTGTVSKYSGNNVVQEYRDG